MPRSEFLPFNKLNGQKVLYYKKVIFIIKTANYRNSHKTRIFAVRGVEIEIIEALRQTVKLVKIWD